MAPDEQPPPAQGSAAEAVPDPEEDDLDDLDDVLDEFQNTKIDAQPTTATSTSPSASGPGRPEQTTSPPTAAIPPPAATENAPPSVESDEDFAKQLQAGMAELLGELQANPDMAKQFEEMMGQFGGMPGLGGGAAAPAAPTANKPAASPTAGGSTSAPGDDTFQDTIKRTMERMQASNTSASAAAASAPSGEDAMFAQLLKEFQGGEGGAGTDDAFSSMLLSMMEQLTNKEVLYEPMKELDTKFPDWLAEREPGAAKAGSITDEELTRYRTQKELVREIVARFEQPSYNDNTPADREFIVDRMQKMQEAGAPPPELVGDVNAAQAMLGDMDPEAGCPQQ